MKFLADHCLSMRTIKFLKQQGFSITTLKELYKHKLTDPQVLSLAVDRGEILITEDRGFGNILEYPLYSHNGIIFVASKTRERKMLHSALRNFLDNTCFEKIKGKLIVFEDNVVRIRK